jgi:predicted acylesterase/phospholipase RssA/CRP-like cAMP-binding protein
MSDDVFALLKVHEYFQDVSEASLREVAARSQVTRYETGDIVHEPDAILTTVGFVLRGRLKAVRINLSGEESLFRMIERGQQYGMMLGALSEPVPIRLIALEPTTVLSLDYERAMELTILHEDLRRHWLKTYARGLRTLFLGASPKQAPTMLALFYDSSATCRTAERLIKRLSEVGENLAVFSDADGSQGLEGVRRRSLEVDGRELSIEEIRRQATEWRDANRIVFLVSADLKPERGARLMEVVDRAILFAQATASDDAVRRLESLEAPTRSWRDKVSVAWLLESGVPLSPIVPRVSEVANREFKIYDAAHQAPWGRSLAGGLERLVHDLRGIRIGVALGGGAARGMSHIGVLKALEESGIVVDMIAGTSAGAMTGIVYSSGLDPAYLANRFATDLCPSWLFRRMPRGRHWYLLYKYRRGHFDPMLRRYLHDWRLEQLAIPCLSVTVDLVGGKSVVRERGDAVHAILESINLPVLSAPIIRNGEALIDGGLVNNIPADVLVSMGCNFVIAVSVTAKIETTFCNISPENPTRPASKPSVVSTLLRSLLVQNHNLNSIGVQPADVVIEPDVTSFDMTEFMRAKELCAVGEAAAREQIPKIQRLLSRLDPLLFRPPAESRSKSAPPP